MKIKPTFLQTALLCAVVLGLQWLAVPAAAETAKTIPFDQLGTEAGKDYHGDGLSVTPTATGADLRCDFQKLRGHVTAEGLWLESATTETSGVPFRVVALSIGRETSLALPTVGKIETTSALARFVRAGLVEEYSVSVDGVRQDFLVNNKPDGAGPLRVELSVDGAKAETTPTGANLILKDSGRKLTYQRLNVTDANGQTLTAHLEVVSENRLALIVDDAKASYPVRIDPTFSDANWISLGGVLGANNTVNAAVVDGAGNLYIGGNFTVAGDTNANCIAKWNGSSWSALGPGVNGTVLALAMSGSDVYAGGYFTTAGGSAASHIAKWNGSNWSALGSGMDGDVYSLAVSNTNLYAGGDFTTAGGSAANRIAKWNGSSWSALSSGMNGSVLALTVSGSDVYAGGQFTTAGGSAANYIAKWNASSWSALGSGMDSFVSALAVSGSDVYAGGNFSLAGGSFASRVVKWNGSSWTALDSGMTGYNVSALAVSGSDVYAGGDFQKTGGSAANYIAKWNGTSWSALGSGINNVVYALAVLGSDVYAGGKFTTTGGIAANYIAKWNGSSWSALDSGLNGSVSALAVSGSDVYVGGQFTTAGGNAANRIAKWNGSWTALDSGLNGSVSALAVSGSDVYAGGDFTGAGGNAANRVAKWNGSSWSALGAGINNTVRALAVSGSDVYVGGFFSTAGGNAAANVAKWNGSSWSPLSSGVNSTVTALAVSGTNLYAGGGFSMAGGSPANYIAKWNGASWSALSSGMDYWVYALLVSGTNLYAGGQFTTTGNRIAKWNGSSWSALDSGINSDLNALAVSGSDVYAAGGKFSGYAAKASLPAAPTILTQPTNQTVSLTSNATFSVTASGTLPLAYQWRTNSFTISGGTNSSLTISNAGFGSAGNYFVIVTNAYGAVTSSVVVLTVIDPKPVITNQPPDQTLPIGNTASFSVAATGASPLNYQWSFNNGLYAGATNATLAFGPALTNQAGNYQVIITNLYGSATSRVAVLTVLLQPNAYGISNSPVNGNGISLSLASIPNSISRVWASTNLVQWQPISTNVVGANGLFQFTDTNLIGNPKKYYRVSTP